MRILLVVACNVQTEEQTEEQREGGSYDQQHQRNEDKQEDWEEDYPPRQCDNACEIENEQNDTGDDAERDQVDFHDMSSAVEDCDALACVGVQWFVTENESPLSSRVLIDRTGEDAVRDDDECELHAAIRVLLSASH